jgi:hypothetical protein
MVVASSSSARPRLGRGTAATLGRLGNIGAGANRAGWLILWEANAAAVPKIPLPVKNYKYRK